VPRPGSARFEAGATSCSYLLPIVLKRSRKFNTCWKGKDKRRDFKQLRATVEAELQDGRLMLPKGGRQPPASSQSMWNADSIVNKQIKKGQPMLPFFGIRR